MTMRPQSIAQLMNLTRMMLKDGSEVECATVHEVTNGPWTEEWGKQRMRLNGKRLNIEGCAFDLYPGGELTITLWYCLHF